MQITTRWNDRGAIGVRVEGGPENENISDLSGKSLEIGLWFTMCLCGLRCVDKGDHVARQLTFRGHATVPEPDIAYGDRSLLHSITNRRHCHAPVLLQNPSCLMQGSSSII